MTRTIATAEACVIGDRCLEEGDGALLFLVGQDLRKGDAGCVVDRDVDELPAGAAGLALLGIASDSMAYALEAAELLDVDVDHIAGRLVHVAAHRFGRLQVPEPRQSGAPQHPADGGRRDPDCNGDVPSGQPLAAQGDDALGHILSGHARCDVRPRRAVEHAGSTLGPVALHPARHDLRRHAMHTRRMGFGKAAFYYRQRHLLST
jgi:hypothetical protein